MIRAPRREPPPEMYTDEPVLFRGGPHWMSEDITIGLALLLVGYSIGATLIDPALLRYSVIAAVPLLIRLATELPRYWRFETVLTSRRLVLNVGMLRDIYQTLLVRDMVSVRVERGRLGRLLGYGSVAITMRGQDATGAPKQGTITLDHVRDPKTLAVALRQAMGPATEPTEHAPLAPESG